jgi:hypothetical protein
MTHKLADIGSMGLVAVARARLPHPAALHWSHAVYQGHRRALAALPDHRDGGRGRPNDPLEEGSFSRSGRIGAASRPTTPSQAHGAASVAALQRRLRRARLPIPSANV